MTDWQLCVVQSGLLSTRSSPRCAQLLPTRHARRQRTPSRSGSITLVVRTGRRAVALAELLRQGGLEPDGSRPRPPRLEHYEGPLRESILDLYRQLGGRLDQPNLRPGSWDLSMGGIVIELDEELHFNRYRSVTLQQAWASALPWTNDYVDIAQLESMSACVPRAGANAGRTPPQSGCSVPPPNQAISTLRPAHRGGSSAPCTTP